MSAHEVNTMDIIAALVIAALCIFIMDMGLHALVQMNHPVTCATAKECEGL